MATEERLIEQNPRFTGLMIRTSPTLNEAGITNAMGLTVIGDRLEHGGLQWSRGVRSNLDPAKYPGQEGAIEELNERGEANVQMWARHLGFRALARPLRSNGNGGLARIEASDFTLREKDDAPIAYTAEPADFVMLNRDAMPGAGIMYGVADSLTAMLAAPDSVGIIHGIRGAVAEHNIGERAAAFMCEEASVDPAELTAVITPGLQVCCHKIGERVGDAALSPLVQTIMSEIETGHLPGSALWSVGGINRTDYYFNSQSALIHQLERAGVQNIKFDPECTAALPSRGHKPQPVYAFASLRRANELGQDTVQVHDQRVQLQGPDKVSRNPVMIGWKA